MKSKPLVSETRIEKRQELASGEVILTLSQKDIALAARPGQFVNLSCDQLLRRPLGIMGADRQVGLFQVGIRVQGKGTAYLASRKEGDILSVLGPLGNGFHLANYQKVITVGGGTGVFPLLFVHQTCAELGIDSVAICGYRSRQQSFLTEDYSQLGCQVLFASDAGDMDISGHAGQALEIFLHKENLPADTAVLTCGPRPMMQAITRLAQNYNLPCQVSLEERMACGIGVCLVCTCEIKKDAAGDLISRERCCVEGPVFPAEVVVW